MDKFSTQQREEARKLGIFFQDLMDNHKDCVKYYISETSVLDWFGQTVKGEKNITAFIKTNIGTCKHNFSNAVPTEKIGFRDSHVIKLPRNKQQLVPKRTQLETNNKECTPPNCTIPSAAGCSDTNNEVEKGQGDGLHNCEPFVSPVKKSRLDSGDSSVVATPKTNTTSDEDLPVKYLTCEGSIEFRRISSKKLQSETKWTRPCKLHIAYTCNSFDDCTLHLVIYEGNMKCRRNLLKEFDELNE